MGLPFTAGDIPGDPHFNTPLPSITIWPHGLGGAQVPQIYEGRNGVFLNASHGDAVDICKRLGGVKWHMRKWCDMEGNMIPHHSDFHKHT